MRYGLVLIAGYWNSVSTGTSVAVLQWDS
jgi:hypothetical protein